MRCPFCGAEDTKVVDSRPAEAGAVIRRRRECENCSNRFTTYERRDAALVVSKRDGRVEPFSAAKVLSGMSKALADRDLPTGTLEGIVRDIEQYAQEQGPVVSTEVIGHLVLGGLRDIDDVAYLRFASVYKEFQGADDFEREMAAMDEEG